MIPLLIAASLLAPSDAPSEAIKAKDGSVHAAAFVDAVRVNIRPEMRERLAPIVAAIRYAENGARGKEYGILHPRVDPTYRSQAGWCAATVQKNWDRWVKAGKRGDFITFLGGRYCPLDDPRDKGGLNKHWIPNVKRFSMSFSRKEGGSGVNSEFGHIRPPKNSVRAFFLNAPSTDIG